MQGSSRSGRQESDHDHHDEHDHSAHDHDGHDHHDHDSHAHHDDHDEHDHHDHAAHDDHEGHDHHDDHAGHDHHGHDHGGHDHAHELRQTSRRSLIIALSLISTYMVAEVVGGIWSGSLALIADAGHMLTDAAAIVMALVAMWIAEKEASIERTFGYQRAEVLAALANTFALWLIAGWIVFEAYHRAFTEEVEIHGLPVLLVGMGGLVINIVVAWILHRSSQHSMNVEGAFQHVLADLMGSVGVVISAIFVLTLEWYVVDPILSVVIAALIVWSSRHLMVTVLQVLLEGVPRHIDVYKLCSDIEDVEGVTIIHDVHVWTITSGSEAFTAHVLVDPSYDGSGVRQILERIQAITHDQYGIDHVTIQVEQSVSNCSEDHHVGHLEYTSRPSAA